MAQETLEKTVIGRKYTCLRPLHLNDYTIDSIVFYNENGIIYQTNSGWLESADYVTEDNIFQWQVKKDVENIKIAPPTKRVKENFTRKENFYMSVKNDYSWDKEKKAKLYIYVDNVNIKFEKLFENTREENQTTVVYDCTYSVTEITGITDTPIKLLSTTISNKRESDEMELVRAFKEENKSYPLCDIKDYTLAELFKKYTLVKKS